MLRLVRHLIAVFAPMGVLVMGLDDTIERRRGKHIAAKGIYRDPVRSSNSHLVKASGLRWLSLMLLVPIPLAQGVWALPFLTVLAPSQRYHEQRNHRHKQLRDYARQMVRQVRRPVHRSKRVAQWLEQHQEQIRLFLLPSYSPQLNPDELLNHDVKANAIGRQRPKTLTQMMDNLRSYLRITQRYPHIIQNYFREKHVAYAAA